MRGIKRPVDALPSVTYIGECLRLDVDTGHLFWRSRPRSHFTSDRVWKMWNTKYAGKRAGYSYEDGHSFLKLDQKNYYTYIIVWVLDRGVWPLFQIDHKDCDPSNDRPRNLREADASDQGCNARARSSNKLGLKNISKSGNRYDVCVEKRGHRMRARFVHVEDAVSFAAYARKELHGEFARND